MALRQPFPSPKDFGLRAERVELRCKRMVQDGEALIPGSGPKKHLNEIFGSVPPEVGKIQNERRYFVAFHTQNRSNTEWLDKYVQPECVAILSHDRRPISQTAHKCSQYRRPLYRTWH